MFNHSAVTETAKKLSLTEAEVEVALKVEREYRRVEQSIKAKDSEKRRQNAKQKAIEEAEQEHPAWCFCEDKGIKVERKHEADGIVRYYTAYGPFDFHHSNPFQEAVYCCSNCGKEYIDAPAMA